MFEDQTAEIVGLGGEGGSAGAGTGCGGADALAVKFLSMASNSPPATLRSLLATFTSFVRNDLTK